MLLEAADGVPVLAGPQAYLNGLDGGLELLDGGDNRLVGTGGGGADGVAVRARSLPLGGVDHHVHGPGLDESHDRLLPVGAHALAELAHHGGGDAVASQHLGGAGGGQDGEPQLGQAGHRQDDRPLVPVGHGDEDRALTGQAAVGP